MSGRSPDKDGKYTCSGCKRKAPIQGIIDNWSSDDKGGMLCWNCQKKNKKGWFEPKKKKDDTKRNG